MAAGSAGCGAVHWWRTRIMPSVSMAKQITKIAAKPFRVWAVQRIAGRGPY